MSKRTRNGDGSLTVGSDARIESSFIPASSERASDQSHHFTMAREFVYSSWGDILTWFLRVEFVMDDEKLVEAVRSFPSLGK